jgi:3-hydroxyisobutyrate dehydrogenase
MSAKISILGLGIMGAAMARSAARGGLNTTAWDRSPERASSFANDQVQIAQCARDAVQDADIVVTNGVERRCCAEHHEENERSCRQ